MTTLLAIGDMHLGRPPAAIPDDLRDRQAELGPEAAFSRAVDAALGHRVDAVLLAGDLVDQDRDFFVAYGQLRRGIERLAEAGIPVLAVAGNHDTEVLPRLATEIEGLELLGSGGQWQARSLDDLTILGWSFPKARVRSSPLDSLPPTESFGTTLGLLHCDLDQPDSPYAPVASRTLEDAPVDAWLLGHVHRPGDLDQDRPIGYLGSVTALRASETGPRGAWLVRVEQGDFSADHLALAPLRFEAVDIDCSQLEDPDALRETILAATRERLHPMASASPGPLALGVRITLTGTSRVAGALNQAAFELATDGRSWDEGGIACFIQRITPAVLPRLDLERLARQTDPCGLLARRLLALEEPESEEYRRLIRLGRESMMPVLHSREFRELDVEPDDHAVADWMKRAGRLALTRLVGQREDGR